MKNLKILGRKSVLCLALLTTNVWAQNPRRAAPAPRPVAAEEVSRPAPRETRSSPSFQRIRYDLGFSTGTSRGTSFYELNLGLDIFLTSWFSIRNAPFLRFQSGQDKNYGLDSSGRLNYAVGLDSLALDFHGGAGYRFQNLRSNVPFGELGLGVQLGGLHIGGNVKALVYSWVNSGAANEYVYTLSASGSGGF